MTDITELAQRNELLIANGQQTADLLRHLADNEIDSDYFAVVSECESYGKETDAELSITEFALRAAGYVDALVEALEKVQRYIEELREWNAGLAQESCERQQRISELLEGKVGNALLERENHHVELVGKLAERIAELESRTVTVKLPESFRLAKSSSGLTYYYADEVDAALTAAGIKVEAE
ncbi:hypothetical protein [Klebsiella pneumoniae]|uniref:hypothetical protein n=1 Tax=Klebsiella pneumoniae TaxID=573 RepID=UPI000E2BDA77|nr:hypothetical protein [Klebsiella pneumoniae]MDF0741125.1 hypothetical protein [Klebsiella pneumoniae]MDF0744852.1 hypothetical protein [Klebsiella pneumoniae]MDH8169731.1 hypothetical protein [Klebsiella pneumoniae]MDH8578257.1 hypothetical protein [Klebsiella pneumoniae]UWB41524.1 hypothetical protein M5S57_10320 [Klebsiella pneumoniae]